MDSFSKQLRAPYGDVWFTASEIQRLPPLELNSLVSVHYYHSLCLSLSLSLSVCLSLPVSLSISLCLSLCLSFSQSVCLSLSLFSHCLIFCLSLSLSASVTFWVCFSVSVCLCVHRIARWYVSLHALQTSDNGFKKIFFYLYHYQFIITWCAYCSFTEPFNSCHKLS